MKPHFSQDRRRDNRRKDDRKQDAGEHGGAREGQRRQGQRRQGERRRSFRIIYPLTLAPITLNGNFRIINLSQQGILLGWEGRQEECPVDLTLGSAINLQIQFHDGETLDLAVEIIRCQSERCSRMGIYAGTLEPGLSPARISTEEAHLLRAVPDFCRVEWDSTPPILDD